MSTLKETTDAHQKKAFSIIFSNALEDGSLLGTNPQYPSRDLENGDFITKMHLLPKQPHPAVEIHTYFHHVENLDPRLAKVLYVVATKPTHDLGPDETPEVIGKMHGVWINRSLITSTLPPDSKESWLTSPIAKAHQMFHERCLTEIFDESGRLKEKFVTGGETGSGVWGRELEQGNLFVVRWVLAAREWRGMGLGELMFRTLMEKAGTLSPGSGSGSGDAGNGELDAETGFRFALVEFMPIRGEHGDSNRAQREKTKKQSLAFYRRFGFRRVGTSGVFAFAVDGGHGSRGLGAGEDGAFD